MSIVCEIVSFFSSCEHDTMAFSANEDDYVLYLTSEFENSDDSEYERPNISSDNREFEDNDATFDVGGGA